MSGRSVYRSDANILSYLSDEKVLLCDSVIGHECQNAVRPTGESAWDNNTTINNFQSLPSREYGNSLFSSSEN